MEYNVSYCYKKSLLREQESNQTS